MPTFQETALLLSKFMDEPYTYFEVTCVNDGYGKKMLVSIGQDNNFDACERFDYGLVNFYFDQSGSVKFPDDAEFGQWLLKTLTMAGME